MPRKPRPKLDTAPFDPTLQIPVPWGPAPVPPPAPPGQEGESDRDENGHFKAGNQAAVGKGRNPYMAQLNRLRHQVYASVNEGDVAGVLRALTKQAKAGSCKHIEVLLALIGLKPSQKIDVTASSISPEDALARVAAYFGFENAGDVQPPTPAALPPSPGQLDSPSTSSAAPGPVGQASTGRQVDESSTSIDTPAAATVMIEMIRKDPAKAEEDQPPMNADEHR